MVETVSWLIKMAAVLAQYVPPIQLRLWPFACINSFLNHPWTGCFLLLYHTCAAMMEYHRLGHL